MDKDPPNPYNLEGAHCLIIDNAQAPDLNGLQGTVLSYNAPTKRYILQLKDGRKVALVGGCLKILAHEDDDAEERAFTADELANMDRRMLNLQQSDLSLAKKVHHTSTSTHATNVSRARDIDQRPATLPQEQPSAYQLWAQGAQAEGTFAMSTSPGQTEPFSRSDSLSRSDTFSSNLSSGTTSEVWSATSMKKNTFANDEVHHAVKALIDEKTGAMPEEQITGAYKHPNSAPYLNALDELTAKLGRSITDSEKAYFDLKIRRRYCQQMRRTPGGASRESNAQGKFHSVLDELGDERPEGTGVPQRCWDAETKECGRCQEPFTMFKRRHHCRGCGINVCDNCSPDETRLPEGLGYGDTPQRVCKVCVAFRKARSIDRMVNFG